MDFSSSRKYNFRKGRLYLGVSPILRRPLGVKTERHAITIAGAGAGKGACVIVPNLLRWGGNALVIDPKGEAAALTWKARQKMGQKVHVLDPFKVADVPDELRASFNPLSLIDPKSITAREDLKVIADGLVRRADPRHKQWDDGAVNILAGVMAFVLADAPADQRTMTAVRSLLLQERDALWEDAGHMQNCEAFGRLAVAAGVMIRTAFETDKSIERDSLNAARSHTEWLDSEPIAQMLKASSFALSDLKHGQATVFLVLPPNYMDTHATFLRLFVRCALNAMGSMQHGHELRDRQCLFLLDEFFTLGKIDEITRAAGLMRGWGLQLWPILQDLGQLYQLYGKDGADTFFGNSDLHAFFGNTDQTTLEYISKAFGIQERAGLMKTEQDSVGRPFMSPREIRAHIAKRQNDKVARRMIVFTQGSDVLSVRPRPFFHGKKL